MKVYVLVLLTCLAVSSQILAKNSPKDIAAKAISMYLEGWQQKNGEIFARPFSHEAQFVNIFGMHFVSKAQIAARHQKIFDTFLKGTSLSIETIKIKKLASNALLAHVVWNLKGLSSPYCQKNTKENSLKCPRRGMFSHVLMPQNKTWQIVSTQNTVLSKPEKG